MNRKHLLYIIFAIVLINVIPFTQIPNVQAATGNTINSNAWRTNGVTPQRKDFYANGRWWYFYKQASAGNFVYSSSSDNGASWDAAILFKAGDSSDGLCSVAYDNVTGVFHVAYELAQTYALYYRRGTPWPDGTITWGIEQTIHTQSGPYFLRPSIKLDSNGYPWIGCYHGLIYRSSTKDGTWTTPVGFPKSLTYNGCVEPVPLPNGKMYFVFAQDYTYDYHPVRGISWNGSTWSSEEVISSSKILSNIDFSATGNDAGYVMFTYLTKYGPYELHYRQRNPSGTWATEEVIPSVTTLWSMSHPAMSTISNGNCSYVFWAESHTPGPACNGSVFYNKRLYGVWDLTPTAFLDESYDGMNVLYGVEIGSTYQSINSTKVGVFYNTLTNGTGSTKLKFSRFSTAKPINIDVSIADMEGCGNWLFAQEKYYTFEATYQHPLGVGYIDFGKVRFNDGYNTVTVSYDYQENKLYLEDGGECVFIKYTSHSETVTQLTLSFGIFLQDTISDAANVGLYMRSNSTLGEDTGWELIKDNYFNIYCVGGYVETLSSGTAGRLDGGDTFELWVGGQTDSWIAANQTWRKLQHYHTSFSLQGLYNNTGTITEEDQIFEDEVHASSPADLHTAKGDWKVYVSIYYCVNDTWVKGWTLELQMEEGDRAGTLLTVGDFWCKLNATWYQKDTKIKSSVFNSFIEIEPSARIRFWLDLWFNEANASTVAGGRINAYYYGMKDESWMLWPDYRPQMDYALDSFYFQSLLDQNDAVISSTQLKMMKVGFNLTKPTPDPSSDAFVLKMRDFEESEAQRVYLGPNPMRGISTPVVQEPKLPDMSSFGFFSPIINALRSLATRLVNALIYTGMEVWKYMVSFFDTIFSSLGWHNGFSTMTGWLTQFFAWIPTAVGYMIQIFTQVFRVITVGLPLLVQGLTIVIGYGVNIFSTIGSLYTAVAEFFGGIWDLYLAQFWAIGLQLAPFAVALYICHLIFLVTSGQADDAEHEVRLIYNFAKLTVKVTMFFVDVFYKIAQLTLQIVMGLIGVL